jgi:hypothetical protein
MGNDVSMKLVTHYPSSKFYLKPDATEQDVKEAMYLSEALELGKQLMYPCIRFAYDHIQELIDEAPTPYSEHSERWEPILNTFYRSFAIAFSNPSRLPEHTLPVILKHKIIDLLNKHNEEANPSKKVGFQGEAGFMALCWNEEKHRFKYPSFKKLMTGHWIIDKQELIDELMEKWRLAHPTSDIPSPSHTD